MRIKKKAKGYKNNSNISLDSKNRKLSSNVSSIIKDVEINRDEAILKYNIKFDNNDNRKFKLTNLDIKRAYKKVDKKIIAAIKYSIKNISKFAEKQKKMINPIEVRMPFGVLKQVPIPIEKIGCYVPGGNYPLLSSALMTVVTAKIAGAKNIIVCSPKIKPEVVVASDLAGADKIFNIGGVQAIAGMAYGTKQIPKVDKIVGPGNIYVSEAKRQLYGKVGVDFIAGPSEILIIADESANEEYIKADLQAQYEHDKDAIVNIIKVNSKNIKNINNAIKKSNEIAPEHLELIVKEPEYYIKRLKNYGAMFIGNNSTVAFGDYASGTNHVLPTNGTAKFSGGLCVFDFIKFVTQQEMPEISSSDKLQKKSYNELIEMTSILAEAEGLVKHKESVEIRKVNYQT